MPFEDLLTELAARRQLALDMGGAGKLAQRKAQGLLNARERIDRLFDPGTFIESGMLAVSNRPEDRLTTPADGKVGGFGRINGRETAHRGDQRADRRQQRDPADGGCDGAEHHRDR